jgi:hypothetical protein
VSGGISGKADVPNRGADENTRESVANLRQIPPQIVSVAQAQLVDFAMQRGAGNVEILCGLRNITTRTRESAKQHGTLGGTDVIAVGRRMPD